jgi:hypothetical protein
MCCAITPPWFYEWGGPFPYRALHGIYDAFLPMAYFTHRVSGRNAVYQWVSDNVRAIRQGTGNRRVVAGPGRLLGERVREPVEDRADLVGAGRCHVEPEQVRPLRPQVLGTAVRPVAELLDRRLDAGTGPRRDPLRGVQHVGHGLP